ncbi:MAG: hypothetical protein HY828_17645 [Actinobacteria bacterium]|nr:hypothetical protein [Actinomycetota bacterium]
MSNAQVGPDNLRPIFMNWAEGSGHIESLVHLTHEGYTSLCRDKEVLRLLKVEDFRQHRADKIAAMAKTEIDAGYPIVHSSMLMVLWSLLETFIEDLVVASIVANPASVGADAFRRVRVPAATLLESPDDAAKTLLSEWRRELKSPLEQGVTRFEPLLELAGLSGPVPARVRKAIFDAQQVRNVWAHRAGNADQRFIDKCPGFGLAVGDRVALAMDEFGRLMHGMHMYVTLIHCRYQARRGVTPELAHCEGFDGVLEGLDFTIGAAQSP